MSLYNKVLESIIKNKALKEEGKYNGLPMPFQRLSEYIPCFEKGMSIGILGATGSAKSRLSRFIFLYHAYKFYKETGYKLKIVYLPLEDNKEKVYRNIICNYLKDVHNITVTLHELDSKGKRLLPDFVLQKLLEAEQYFKEFEDIVYIIDGENQPQKIYELCKEIALSLGTIEEYYVELPFGRQKKQYRYVSDYHIFCIVDNMSNIDPEEGSIEHKAINDFAKDYVRGKLCNFFGWTVIQVLQLDFESEKQAFTKEGQSIIAKVEPSLAGIGDSKRVSRSMHLIFGLFSPARYGLERFPIPPKNNPHEYYDIGVLGNRFRSIQVIKSNDSDCGMKLPVLFDGVGESFEELPLPQSNEMKKIYEEVSGKPRFVKVKNQLTFKEEADEMPF